MSRKDPAGNPLVASQPPISSCPFASTLMEAAEGRQNDVLALAVFELAAGEDDEAAGEQAKPRRRMEEARVHALEHGRHPVEAVAAQNLRDPGGSCDQPRLTLAAGASLLAQGRALEEDDADLAPGAAGIGCRRLQIVAERDQDVEVELGARSELPAERL